ncbi:unnamed protein product [Closterium sp. NIES-54]
MVDLVANAGIADTLEACLADARKRHADGEYGTIPLLIVELGIRSQCATEHPSRPVSPRSVRNEGGVDDKVDGGARVSGNNGTKQRGVIKVDGGVKRSQARVQQSMAAAGSSHVDIDGRRRSPLRSGGGLSATTQMTADRIAPTYGYFKFSPRLDYRRTSTRSTRPHHLEGVDRTSTGGRRAEELRRRHSANAVRGRCRATRGVSCGSLAHLHGHLEVLLAGGAAGAQDLSRVTGCWSPGMALHPVDVPGQGRRVHRTARGENDPHSNGRAGVGNRLLQLARRILAEVRMAGAEYSKASYISHIVKGLPRGYNLMKMMMVPGMRESLDEDSITSYILQDEAMQEAEQPTELLPQVNYATPTKLNQQQGKRRKPGGGGSVGGRSTMDVDEKRSTRDKGRGGGGRPRERWICHDLDHLCYECPDRDDSDEDDIEGSHDRSTSRRPSRDANLRKEKQTTSAKDVNNSSGMSRGDGEALCLMVGVAVSTVSLAPDAGEDFQAVATAVQANPMAVLLDSGFSHHLMGTKVVFVDMAPSDGVKHVRGFNGALQPVEGRGTVVLQGEVGKRVLC